MLKYFKRKIQEYISITVESKVNFIYPEIELFRNLNSNVFHLNNYNELKKIFSWHLDPVLERPDIQGFEYIADINERRIRDAESIATVIRNINPQTILEIGTANGMGTVLMAANATDAKIFTINITPEEIASGLGGELTTIALEREKIGIEYKKKNLPNITQILSNTATWEPNIGTIDLAFIDGCHDTEFVYNDTRKILPFMRKGGFILWHDFNPHLIKNYHWINSVCLGVEKLYAQGLIKGEMFHIKDSWVGIYQVS